MKNFALLLLAIFSFLSACSQTKTTDLPEVSKEKIKVGWDADAGVIESLTVSGKTSSSSKSNLSSKITDERKESHWQSDPPFPHNFLTKNSQNFLFDFLKNKSNYTASNISNASLVTDGSLHSPAKVSKGSTGEAFLEINFSKLRPLKTIVVRVKKSTSDIQFFIKKNNTLVEKNFDFNQPEPDSKTLRIAVDEKDVKGIVFKSKNDFSIFEIAALETAPKEWAMVDLGEIKKVGWVDTRHWAGDKTADFSALLLSEDGKNWTKVKDLDPNALQTVSTIIDPPIPARYVKVEHGVSERDWNSVFIWEIDVYDQYGPYGKMPTPQMNKNSFSDIMGVNGIWGWGFEKYADLVEPGRGADLFEKISSHARNYHFLMWDVMDPDTPPDYDKMALGKGTEVNWWLNWDREYKKWTEDDMKLQTSIQFRDIPKDQWDDPRKAAYKFGYLFAQHFGPTAGNGMVDAIEAGNEPWYYEADFYKEILHGMTKGIKDADPKITVLPCALQAAFPANEYEGQFKNYMGARVTEEVKPYIDALNTHLTPWSYNEAGEQIATHPEHPYNGTRAILNVLRFRNHNLPKLPIYVTEWGWDSDGGKESCVHGECVSEKAQALYAVRGALMLSRLGIDRATWYFFANENKESSLFTRSGLVSSLSSDFQIKKAFVAWEAFLHHLGDKHFLKVIREDDEAWIYALGNKDGKVTHVAAWAPLDGDSKKINEIQFRVPQKLKAAWKLEGKNKKGTSIALPQVINGRINLMVGTVPILIEVE